MVHQVDLRPLRVNLVEIRVIDMDIMRKRFSGSCFQVVLQAQHEYTPFCTAVRKKWGFRFPLSMLKVDHDLVFQLFEVKTDARVEPLTCITTHCPFDVFVLNVCSDFHHYDVAVK